MEWVALDRLPKKLFLPLRQLMKGEKSGVAFGVDNAIVRKLKIRR
jgi:hypothetical protein